MLFLHSAALQANLERNSGNVGERIWLQYVDSALTDIIFYHPLSCPAWCVQRSLSAHAAARVGQQQKSVDNINIKG